MPATLSILFWLAALAYAASFALFSGALVFRRARALDLALGAAWIGFFAHTVFVAARWAQIRHPPFVSYFESMSASAWFAMLAYLTLQQWKPFVRGAGAGVLPFVALLMGWAGTHPIGGEILPVSLQSFWLFIHASFATAAAGCFMLAAGVALVRLHRRPASAERADEFNYRLTVLGFLFWTIMIVSGAIWADAAWGRYWAWDPVELWSLISLLVYAIYIHAYTAARRLRGVFLAWYSVAAVFFVAFSLWGIHFLYDTLHSYGDT